MYGGGGQPIVCDTTAGLMAQGSIKTRLNKSVGAANKKYPSMTSVSAPASKFLSCLGLCPDFLQWQIVMRKYRPDNLFPL